jgi:hypothetical protein
MKWVKITDRKPPKPGMYFWRGKTNYGGYCEWGRVETDEGGWEDGFDFPDSVPTNKVGDDYLMWLDETDYTQFHHLSGKLGLAAAQVINARPLTLSNRINDLADALDAYDKEVVDLLHKENHPAEEDKPHQNWPSLRQKFFDECVMKVDGSTPRIDLAPHDLFEWFKKQIYE